MIEERVAYPHYVIVTQIKTDGRSACSVTKTVRRAPGYRYFEQDTATGEVRASESHFENLACSIKSE